MRLHFCFWAAAANIAEQQFFIVVKCFEMDFYLVVPSTRELKLGLRSDLLGVFFFSSLVLLLQLV